MFKDIYNMAKYEKGIKDKVAVAIKIFITKGFEKKVLKLKKWKKEQKDSIMHIAAEIYSTEESVLDVKREADRMYEFIKSKA